MFRVFRSPRASAEDEAAFTEHLVARVAIYGATTAIALNVLQLLWWPTDALVLASDAWVRTMQWFRGATFVNHGIVLLLLSLPATRGRSVAIFMAGAFVSAALLGAAVSQLGPLDQPYYHMTYMAPLAVVAIPLRLWQRIVTDYFVGATITTLYLVSRPAELASPFLSPSIGCMLFAATVSVCCGHLLFILTRVAFLSERALARSAAALRGYSEHLEDRVAEYTEQLRRLAAHLERVSEAERARLSRDLHDALGQQITAMRYTLAYVRTRFHHDPDGAHARLSELEAILADVAAGVRQLVTELRPRVLDDRGLGAAVEWLVERTRVHSGLPCELHLAIDPSIPVSPDLAIAAFRFVQESLTNAVRHAHAEHLRVTIAVDRGGIRLLVEDDGCGVGPADRRSTGMGLLGMSERARAHGGRLEIESRPGTGTAVNVHLPLSAGGVP